MILPVVLEQGQIRPMVPFAMTWRCAACGTDETAEGIALADTGASMSILPETALPPHVRFDDLPGRTSVRMTGPGAMEARLWPATVTVLGVDIATEWKVYRGSRPDYPILGTDGLFRHFRATFDLGAAQPFWSIEPIPATMTPVPIEALPLLAYPESTYRMVGPGSTYATTPGGALQAPTVALAALSGGAAARSTPTLPASPAAAPSSPPMPPANRRQRRAARPRR